MIYLYSTLIVYNDEDNSKVKSLSNKLSAIYAKAKVCDVNLKTESGKECLSLEPELTSLLSNSRDYDTLLLAWEGWHNAAGNPMRNIYTEIVQLQNKGARDNGYSDLSEYWLEDFEQDDFEKTEDKLWSEVKPFYQELHAYVRRKLEQVYSNNYKSDHNPKLIQAHLLGIEKNKNKNKNLKKKVIIKLKIKVTCGLKNGQTYLIY
jgi:peptidyl-dipeptidase A